MNRLKAWILNSLYLVIYLLMTPVILYRCWFRGRPLGSFWQRACGRVPPVASNRHCVWLHAVSVGEVNLLEPVLEQLKTAHPESTFVISVTTATGMELAKNKYPDHACFYFPIDFSWAMQQALSRLSPDLIVLAELEIWPNLLRMAHGRSIPVAVMNGRLSEKSFSGYVKRKWLFQNTFKRIGQVLAQSADDAHRFIRVGCPADRVVVTGSIKFDGALQKPNADLVETLRQALKLSPSDFLWVAGSTQEPEELMVGRIWRDLVKRFPELRLVIVPRHPHRGAAILSGLGKIGVKASLRSQDRGHAVEADEILIADTIGELKGWWQLCDAAFVGGSFGDRGGQNMLEPAACAAAVCFGPNTWNFKAIVRQMLTQRVAVQVASERELEALVEQWISDPEAARQLGEAAFSMVNQSCGAVKKTCDRLGCYFPEVNELEPRQSKAA
ncbi:MAG: 3-deoxy-D-manno-octulosonic acid transferase [Pirellulaceae bacterium]|nr:3-deoxy-D-manno-octulosonic acid transferase [Pirellulaceae bacterium]